LIKEEYDIFLSMIGVDENYLTTIKKESCQQTDFVFPKKYDVKFGFARCPKCQKRDKVYKLVYGNEQLVTVNIHKKDTTYSPMVGREYYMGTCVTSDFNPEWHCERDKIKF
jgi:hypothetical protein